MFQKRVFGKYSGFGSAGDSFGRMPGADLPPSTLLGGLIAYWNLDEASGTRADALGANHLTANNNPLGATGKIGNGCAFLSASSQSLSKAAPVGLAPGTNDFAISFWTYPTSFAANRTVWSWGLQGSGTIFIWILFSTGSGLGRLSAQINDASGAHLALTRTDTTPLNTWSHYVLNFDRDGNLSVAVNGAAFEVMGAISTKQGNIAPSGAFYIGQYAVAQFFNGTLDEVGRWNRLLTADEAAELYNGGTGKTYPFS